jgi:hypothetical protein
VYSFDSFVPQILLAPLQMGSGVLGDAELGIPG